MGTIVVTNISGSQPGTDLVQALAEARNGDTIVIPPQYTYSNIELNTPVEIPTGESLTIEGYSQIQIDLNSGLGSTDSNGNPSLAALTIDKGASLTLLDVTVGGSASVQSADGGQDGSDGAFGESGETAGESGTAGGPGQNAPTGGNSPLTVSLIDNKGSLTLNDSWISSYASGGYGGDGAAGGVGGNGGDGHANAYPTPGGGAGGDGAAGGNGSNGGNGGSAVGGVLNESGATLTLIDSGFEGDGAFGGDGGAGGAGGDGGDGGGGWPSGNGADGGNGGNGGDGGTSVGAIENQGVIQVVGAATLYDNSATASSGGDAGDAGSAGAAGDNGQGGVGDEGSEGTGGTGGAAGETAANLLNLGGAVTGDLMTSGHFYTFGSVTGIPGGYGLDDGEPAATATVTLGATQPLALTYPVAAFGNETVACEVAWQVISGPNGPTAADFGEAALPSGTLTYDGSPYVSYEQPGADNGTQSIHLDLLPDPNTPIVETFTIELTTIVAGDALGVEPMVVQTIDQEPAPVTYPPPTIAGTSTGQQTTDRQTIAPLANVTIADPNAGQTETVTVTLSSAANGTLSNLGSGGYNASTGVYTDTGSPTAVTADLDGLVFAPTTGQVAQGQTVTTTFVVADVDSVDAIATPGTASVLATPAVANNANGTSYLYTLNPTASVTETIAQYSGPNATGTLVSETVDNVGGTSYLYAYNPTGTVKQTTSEYSGPNDTGAQVSDVVDNTNGTSLLYAYNPTATVTLTAQTWSGTNPSNGAPAGNEISDVVDNADGTSLLYSYNPTATVTLTVSEYSATNAANGAPAGNEISDVVDNANGTSILYAYNPSATVTQTASFYSATGAAGAPSGTLTGTTVDYAAGQTYDSLSVGSSIATYNANGSSTQYYSGPDGTGSAVGSPIVSGGDSVAGTNVTTSTNTGNSVTIVSAQALSDSDGATIAISGSNQLVDPGTGNQTVQFLAGATADTLVLHLNGSDQVAGFDPSAGDTLDLSSLLAEAGMNIGGDLSRLANYVSVADVAGSAAIVFDPTGQGGGSQVALLENDGGLVATLQTMKAFVI